MNPTLPNPFLYLQRNAETDPDGVFFETVDQRVSNSEAFTSAKRIAFELRHLGVQPGDLVALDLPETLSMIFTEAVFHEAAVSTVLPRGYESDGSFPLHWIFSSAPTPPASHGGAKVIAVDAEFLRRIEQNPYGTTPREFESEKSTARLVFSSGTTGQPHAISFTLASLEFNATQALDTPLASEPFLTLLPTSSPFGFYGFYLSVKDARPFWSVGSGDTADTVRLAARSSAAALMASPAQIASVVELLEAEDRTLPAVRLVQVLGTVMPPALARRIRAATGGCSIYNLYGSTEATVAFVRYYESDDPFDAGMPFPNSEVQIVDDDSNELPRGQVGMIRHRHPHMVHEYVGNPDATRRVFRDGWFYPGDLGFIRLDGGLTLAGRASEVLNAGGVKIDPAQLDLFAVARENVTDAASFEYETRAGVKQIGMALVTEDALDVQALIRDLDAKFGSAAPKLMARVPEIPRNGMGKPMRRTLAEKYKES